MITMSLSKRALFALAVMGAAASSTAEEAMLTTAQPAGMSNIATRDAPQEVSRTLLRTAPLTLRLPPAKAQPDVVSTEAATVATYAASLPNSCDRAAGALCYDYRNGRALYKPMRKLMPPIPGLTPHNLSIHRDKVILEYSFK